MIFSENNVYVSYIKTQQNTSEIWVIESYENIVITDTWEMLERFYFGDNFTKPKDYNEEDLNTIYI